MITSQRVINSLQPDVLQLAEWVRTSNDPDSSILFHSFFAAWGRLFSSEHRVVFCGAFKAGKSALINALLEDDILPSRVTRATGLVIRVRHSAALEATLISAATGIETPVPFADRGDYILLDVSNGSFMPLSGVEAISLGAPICWLPTNVVLVDTPGIEDNEELTQRTLTELATADLAVMVMSALQFLSLKEREMARQLNETLNGNVLFIINRLGQAHEEEWPDLERRAKLGLQDFGNKLTGTPFCILTDAGAALGTSPSCEVGEAGIKYLRDWLDRSSQTNRLGTISLSTRLHRLEVSISLAISSLNERLSLAKRRREETEEKLRADREAASRQLNLELWEAKSTIVRLQGACLSIEQEWLVPSDAGIDTRQLGSYAGVLSSNVESILRGTGVVVPPLTLNLLSVTDLLSVTERGTATRKSSWGRWIGAAAGSIVAPGVGTVIGVAIGAAIDKKTNSHNAGQVKPAGVGRVSEDIDAQMLALRQQVQEYLSAVEKEVRSRMDRGEDGPSFPPEVIDLQNQETAITALIKVSRRIHSHVCEWKGGLMS